MNPHSVWGMVRIPDPPAPTVQCIVDAASDAVALAFRDSGEIVDIVPIIAAVQRDHPDFILRFFHYGNCST